MKFFELFFLVWLGNCGFSYGATKDISGRNSFAHPYNKRFSGLRIVGGQVASPHQFPFQVALYINKSVNFVFCGGSLISENYVLTAAHCAEGALSFTLVFGAQNLTDNSEETQQRRTSTNYVIHPGWDRSRLINDLAIIKLSEPVTLNEYVQVVKLASGNCTYAEKEGNVTGWGRINDKNPANSDVLRYTSDTILSNTECKEIVGPYGVNVVDVHICLSGIGTCRGDSGGPLLSNGLQVGIVSFSNARCEADLPSLLVRVSQFTDWIEANSDVTF